MGWLERAYGSLMQRFDAAAPALPQPAGPAPAEQRYDSSIVNMITGLGDPTRDKGASTLPVLRRQLPDQYLSNLYGGNGLARRIVNVRPERACRKGWTAPKIGNEERRLLMWPKTQDAMQWGDLFGGGSLLLVTEDDVPRGRFRQQPWLWLAQPLDLRRVQRLHAIQAFDAIEAWPVEYETSLQEPGYRAPSLWQFSTGDGFTALVHGSRVAHFRGARRPPSELRGGFGRWGRMPDDSILQAVYDEIARLVQTMQAGATAAQELRESVLQLGNFAALQVGDEGKLMRGYLSVIAQMKNALGFTVTGSADKFTSHNTPPTGFSELSEGAQMMLATVLGWPRTMLTGESPGALGDGDESGLERERQIISAYQESHREPIEKIYTVLYAAQDGPTRGSAPEGWSVTFHPLSEPTAKEQADLEKVVAEADEIRIRSHVIAPEHVTRSRHSADGYSLILQPVELPTADELKAIEAVRAEEEKAALEKEVDLTGGSASETRARVDAEEKPPGCIILIPSPDPKLRSVVERAVGQAVVPDEDDEPHVTLLWLGRGHTEEEIAEVVAAVTEEARTQEPTILEHGRVHAFGHGEVGTPIVVEFESWALRELNERLLRRLAHLCRDKQFPRYRPHLTLGYAAEPLSAEALAELLKARSDDPGVQVPVVQLQVLVGRKLVATVAVGS
jgi:uncharacterized protein